MSLYYCSYRADDCPLHFSCKVTSFPRFPQARYAQRRKFCKFHHHFCKFFHRFVNFTTLLTLSPNVADSLPAA